MSERSSDIPSSLVQKNDEGEKKAGELASVQGLVQQTSSSTLPFPIMEIGKENSENGKLNSKNISNEMNTKNKVSDSNEEKSSSNQMQFADPTKQIQLKENLKSSGLMTDILGAGPMKTSNQPWSSSWVFGGEPPQMTRAQGNEKLSTDQISLLSKLQTQMNTMASLKGSDEKSIDKKLSDVNQLMESIDGDWKDSEDSPLVGNEKGTQNLLSSEEFLKLIKNDSPSNVRLSSTLPNKVEKTVDLAKDNKSFLESKNQNSEEGLNTLNLLSKEDSLKDLKRKGSSDSESTKNLSHFDETLLKNTGEMKQSQPALQMTSNVVPGSMMRDRLSSESVEQFSNQIHSFAPQGGGEMKIRLNPENLGELMIHVSTQNGNVGLKVQASRGEAKKVLEESVSSLKEALGQQNLILNKVEFTVLPNSSSQQNTQSTLSDQRNDSRQQSMGDQMNQQREDRNNLRMFRSEETSRASASFRPSVRSSSQLDVTA